QAAQGKPGESLGRKATGLRPLSGGEGRRAAGLPSTSGGGALAGPDRTRPRGGRGAGRALPCPAAALPMGARGGATGCASPFCPRPSASPRGLACPASPGQGQRRVYGRQPRREETAVAVSETVACAVFRRGTLYLQLAVVKALVAIWESIN